MRAGRADARPSPSRLRALLGRPGFAFVVALAAGPIALAAARLLPPEGVGLGLRITAAAACVLLVPGAVVLRAVGWPAVPAVAVAGSLSMSLAVLFVALALTFAVDGALTTTLVLVALVALVAAVPAARAGMSSAGRAERVSLAGVALAGALFAFLVWSTTKALGTGDVLFHVARARKLAEADALASLAVANEFRDGGLHPGYAFPLWHGALAAIARLADVDVAVVRLHLPAVLVPLAFVVAYAAGTALFRSWAGGIAVTAAQVAQLGFSRDGTGSFAMLASPASFSRLVLVPALLALTFAYVRGDGRRLLVPLAAAALALAVVHPTYVLFVIVAVAGFAIVWALAARERRAAATRTAAALAAALAPATLFFLWLLPVVSGAEGHQPSESEEARALAHYGGQLETSGDGYRAAPAAITRAGPVVVAGLAMLPLVALAIRRVWASFAVGATLVVLAVLLTPQLFTPLSDVVSISQARRLAQFLPIPFVVAAAAVLAGRLRAAGVAAAFGVGLALELLYRAESSHVIQRGGPVWPLWVALAGTAVALVAVAAFRRRTLVLEPTRWAALAALAFALPIAVAGLARTEPAEAGDPFGLTPGLVEALRRLEQDDVVFARPDVSYRVAAFAAVYVAATPAPHAANTDENQPYRRQRDALRFFAPRAIGDAERRALLAEYGADWLLVDKTRPYPRRFVATLDAPAYEDGRYALFPVSGS